VSEARSCGTCTKCCEGWLPTVILGQQLKVGSPCRFICSGGGCSIYNNGRPDVCVSFTCLWIDDKKVPDWVKPENSKVIARLMPKGFEKDGKRILDIIPAGSVVTDEYRAWAKMYAEQHKLHYREYRGEPDEL
jgi:hypothetical protein